MKKNKVEVLVADDVMDRIERYAEEAGRSSCEAKCARQESETIRKTIEKASDFIDRKTKEAVNYATAALCFSIIAMAGCIAALLAVIFLK